LRRNKGIDTLLAAIDALRDHTQYRFVFAGRGFADVEAAIDAAAVRDARITFERGYVTADRKRELYLGADLIVLPYTEFGSTSGVLADAYAYRVPSVVADVGVLGETVRREQTGWVVPPSDPDALAGAIEHALTATAEWRGASAATETVARESTPTRIGAQVRGLYDTL
jgi:glycosyltransferase involved in cell wall biosynthesis